MNKIINLSEDELNHLANKGIFLDSGAEGEAYYIGNNTILKVFHDFLDMQDYTKEKLLQFSDIEIDSYFFAKKVLCVNGVTRAYTMKRCKGFNLTSINPLSINLDCLLHAYKKFGTDTKKISAKHIKSSDMKYNLMFDGNKFGAIDTVHYYCDDDTINNIYNFNIDCFNDELLLLLTDDYFVDFIKENKELYEIYTCIRNSELTNLSFFLKLFRKKLEEYCDKKINFLFDAKKAARKNPDKEYINNHVYSLMKQK